MIRRMLGLTAMVGCGMALGLWAAPAQAGGTSASGKAKPAVASGKAAKPVDRAPVARGKAGTSTSVAVRPAKLAVAAPPPAREPVLLPVAIEEEAHAARPAKLVPLRAYALDGCSFYQNGQLIRIQGLPETVGTGEHAKQRLQQALDSGQVTVLPVSGAENSQMFAVVRVNGRDLAEAMTDSN